MQRIGQKSVAKTSQQKSHRRYGTIKLAIVIDRAIPRGQRSILYRVIRDSCRSMGNLVSWAWVQDAIVKKKKKKEWRLARVVPLPFSMKPSFLIKDATREPDNPFPRARASFSIASVQDTQTNQRVIGRAWTVLHVGFDFSKVDRKKKKKGDKKEENSDSCTPWGIVKRIFYLEWKYGGKRMRIRWNMIFFFLDICLLFLVYCFFCN